MNSNFVFSRSFSSAPIVYSFTTFFVPSLNTFSNLKAAPASGILRESILLITTLYVNTITLSSGVYPLSPPCSLLGLLENSIYILFGLPKEPMTAFSFNSAVYSTLTFDTSVPKDFTS